MARGATRDRAADSSLQTHISHVTTSVTLVSRTRTVTVCRRRARASHRTPWSAESRDESGVCES
eukprot:6973603-Prymnesium_polylepis.1